jgi:hypothetical protein
MITALSTLWDLISGWWKPLLKYGLPILLVLGALGYLFYRGMEYGENKQSATDVIALNKDTAALVRTTASLVTLTKLVVTQNTAEKAAADASKTTVADLQTKLTAALAKKPTIKTIIKEVPTYVTPAQDASRGPLSVGAVQLYDNSLQTDTGLTGAYTPSSPGISADATSTLLPSTASAVIVYNNTLCLQWRDQLITWQQWYAAEQTIVKNANAAAIQQQGATPPPTPPVPASK